MNGLENAWTSFWWVLPLLLMILCCLGMRGKSVSGICGYRSWGADSRTVLPDDSAAEIIDKRFALGEIGREEYEERKRSLGQGRSH